MRYVRDGEVAVPAPNPRAIELQRPCVFPVASPSLIERLGTPLASAPDLAAAPLIEESDGAEWTLWFAAQGIEPVKVRTIARYGHAHLALAAARSGQGIALANSFLLADDLQSGRLVPVTPANGQFSPVALGAYMFTAESRQWNRPALVHFRKWLAGEFEESASEVSPMGSKAGVPG